MKLPRAVVYNNIVSKHRQENGSEHTIITSAKLHFKIVVTERAWHFEKQNECTSQPHPSTSTVCIEAQVNYQRDNPPCQWQLQQPLWNSAYLHGWLYPKHEPPVNCTNSKLFCLLCCNNSVVFRDELCSSCFLQIKKIASRCCGLHLLAVICTLTLHSTLQDWTVTR